MVYKIDYRDGVVYRWRATPDGATYDCDRDFRPTCYISTADSATRSTAQAHLSSHPAVANTAIERWRTVWRNAPEPVLRLDVRSLDDLTDLAHTIRSWGAPGEYKLYNVDFTREFRYCLETETDPTPQTPLTHSALTLPPKALNDDSIADLTIDGDSVASDEPAVLDEIQAYFAHHDPDVLVLSSSELVPLLYRKADQFDRPEFELGRLPGWQQLASASSFESYGRRMHSPARYNVFGRAIIDRSNSFFWNQTNLAGILDLVKRSWKPIQEAAWASIGNVLTSIQIRVATDREVLVPWNSWRHEQFKPMSTLHEADRGGFIFAPDVGFHEAVHELDFSSLYPNIMVTQNISPDTIRCACHSDRDDVPGLGYSICEKDGFIKAVLEPIITARDEAKATLKTTTDPATRREAEGTASALKWILVSCFGYQGFSNAKFGRIECHEAINAFAREILLDTKETLEQHGWRVVHGIVDSLWVQARPDQSQTPLEIVTAEITEEVGIALEYEAEYDWIAFVPRADSESGALNRYFGKVAGTNEFKKRGIELRQRSTPAYVESCQQAWLETLDEHRDPSAVCEQLRVQLAELRTGRVDPASLLIRRRVSKPLEEYTQYTQSVSALDRAASQSFDVSPGEDVEYLVVDDSKQSAARVKLAYESLDRYDASFYSTLLIRAAESIVSPFGWDRHRIRQYLAQTDATTITAY